MHISGIIFAWLVFPAAVVAAYFSARLIDTRNAWAERVETYREHNEQYAKLVERKERRLQEAQADLERLTTDWGNAWSDVNVTVDKANGAFAADNLGTNLGLGAPDPNAPEKPVVHAFALEPGGTSRYIGWFQATTLRENDSRFVQQWGLIPNETDSWTSGKWRIREHIPRASAERLPGLYLDHTAREERIAARQAILAEQKRLVADAQADLAVRRGELLGDPAANPPVEGLVAAIEREQALRDQAEADVDRLRREIQTAWREMVALAAENLDLTSKGPAVKPVAAAGTGTEPN
ncbi:MAG: hypothetical protein WD069_04860 [Planctomycetales bacterium]